MEHIEVVARSRGVTTREGIDRAQASFLLENGPSRVDEERSRGRVAVDRAEAEKILRDEISEAQEQQRFLKVVEHSDPSAYRRLAASSRGVAPGGGILWGILALVFLITLGVIFLIAPAFFLAALLIIAGLGILVIFRAEPHGLTAGVVVIVIGAALGFLAQGQQLGLLFVHGL